jgi:putative DNA primase/helicase
MSLNEKSQPSRFAPNSEETKPISVDLGQAQQARLTAEGLFLLKPSATGSLVPIQVTLPFEIIAEIRDFKNQNRGLRLRWKDSEDYTHNHMVFRQDLIGDGAEVFRQLASKGFQLINGTSKTHRSTLQAFLLSARSPVKARVVDKVGFHGSTFCLPEHSFGADLMDEQVYFLSEREHKYRCSGTLSEWQDQIAAHAKGNSRLIFSLALAFAPPLLPGLHANGAGFNIFGPSSTGKTTCAYVSGSVWGGPRFYQTWNTTGNALEATAARHNNTLLILDELNSADPKTIGATAYNLANGSSKARLNRYAEAKEIKSWELLYLSTSENTLDDLLRKNHEAAKSGQEVRLVDIPVCPPGVTGGFEHPSTFSDTYALAKHLDTASKAQYGTAIVGYLEKLVALTADDFDELKQWKAEWVKSHTPREADPQVKRVVDLFGLVALAGHLASEWGITNLTDEENDWGIIQCLNSWLTHRGHNGSGETDRAVQYLRDFIDTYGSSRFESICSFDPADIKSIPRRAGWKQKEFLDGPDDNHIDDVTYFFTAGAFREAIKDLNPKEAAKHLHQLGIQKSPTATTRRIPNNGTCRVYEVSDKALTAALIGRSHRTGEFENAE